MVWAVVRQHDRRERLLDVQVAQPQLIATPCSCSAPVCRVTASSEADGEGQGGAAEACRSPGEQVAWRAGDSAVVQAVLAVMPSATRRWCVWKALAQGCFCHIGWALGQHCPAAWISSTPRAARRTLRRAWQVASRANRLPDSSLGSR